ncbi:signal recognition particle-docking protein FtsY [Mesoplasma seiffertii]|uniref:signal recognition particle-docking protein FtsY n=1 Tax=Mesoplasma seiffertii TaxID=28224 RepID=UPI00047ACABF|nr:signal recognition particle-docking protein FtsY [Mesoplasma seiffertii]
MGFWSKLKEKVSKKENNVNETTEAQEQQLIAEFEHKHNLEPEALIKEPPLMEECEPPTPEFGTPPKIVVCPPKPNSKEPQEVVIEVTPTYDSIILDTVPTYHLEDESSELVLQVEHSSDKPAEFEETQFNEPTFEPSKKAIKKAQKDLKRKQKEAAKKEKAEKAMLKSALDFSKDIKKLSKKYKEADDEFFEELEEVLIKTDMGMKMVLQISKAMQKRVKKTTDFNEIKELLIEELYEAYLDKDKKPYHLNFVEGRLNIFMVVGVNGTGKTTSLSKIANFYAEQGYKVLIAAGDTFRAGAVEQLEEWVKTRLDNKVDLIKGKKAHQDPASVIFDAIEQAQAGEYDLLLIDTAGRLQNKVNLMKELEKMHQIVHRFDKSAPHELLLVIDATTGQNGVIQAQQFGEVTKVSGIVLTKMDGTSKGGIALAIKDQLNIPVKLMGIGEQVDDIIEFDLEQYIYGLVAGFMEETEE